jgi:Heterokaryon incompatibility protein (HET)
MLSVLAVSRQGNFLAHPLFSSIRPRWRSKKKFVRVYKEPHPYCAFIILIPTQHFPFFGLIANHLGQCGAGVWEPALFYHGQAEYIQANPLSHALREEVDYWINICNKGCKYTVPDDAEMPFRLIDVGTPDYHQAPRLTEGHGRKGRYVSLSYRWGDDKNALKLTARTYHTFKAAIPMSKVPRTIADAIRVTRWLNVQYLWVDALCIFQGKEHRADWEEQSGQMHKIYGNAWLNVSADAATDSQSGFLKERNLLKHRSCLHPNLIKCPGKTSSAAICPVYEGPDWLPNRSILAKRGWIFQERLLSKRRLHFGEWEVLWDCTGFQASERYPSTQTGEGGSLSEYSISDEMYLNGKRGLGTLRWEDDYQNDRSHAWDEWENLLYLYLPTELTKSSDRLPAFSGVARTFQERCVDRITYLAGVWIEMLPLGLQWHRKGSPKDPPNPERKPSWSWGAVDFEIDWHFQYSDQNGSVKVVDFFGDFGKDPFGNVKSAWLKIEGPVLDDARRVIAASSYQPILDYPQHYPDGDSLGSLKMLVLFEGRASRQSPNDGFVGLLLEPTGRAEEYRRVGTFWTVKERIGTFHPGWRIVTIV